MFPYIATHLSTTLSYHVYLPAMHFDRESVPGVYSMYREV